MGADAALRSIRSCAHIGKLHFPFFRKWQGGLPLWCRKNRSFFTDKKSQWTLTNFDCYQLAVPQWKQTPPASRNAVRKGILRYMSFTTHSLLGQASNALFTHIPIMTVYLLCNFTVFSLTAESNCTGPSMCIFYILPCPSKILSLEGIRTQRFKPIPSHCDYALQG